jgi:hypothetical protein
MDTNEGGGVGHGGIGVDAELWNKGLVFPPTPPKYPAYQDFGIRVDSSDSWALPSDDCPRIARMDTNEGR